jgi:hypothetical protein
VEFTGDQNFAATRVHTKEGACSRRDDIESLAYLLVYMVRGELPWIKLWDSVKDLPRYKGHTQAQFVHLSKTKTKVEVIPFSNQHKIRRGEGASKE